MLRILGSPKTLCNGTSRREFLWAGGLGLFGVGLSDYLRLSALQAATEKTVTAKSFGKAKSCILLFLYGSPSQLEIADMKPDAPLEIRGEMKPIRSSLPGCDVCEYLPHMARVMDRVTVVRSMSHIYPIHGVAFATTGIPQIDVAMELSPRDPRHQPFVGSVVDWVDQRTGKRNRNGVPNHIALPFPFSSHREGEVPRAGPYASYLGTAYNPVWTEFNGTATGRIVKTLGKQELDVAEPYIGISQDSRFELSKVAQLPSDITIDRLNRRKSLLQQFDQSRRDLDESPAGRTNDRFREMAYSFISSEKVRTALDISKEPLALRESYGMTLFGQGALAARRLVEAGSRFVTVFWDEFGLAGSAWDTHWQHYPRMKKELLPGFDMGFAGLIADLDARGMLDDTLVLCISEHGRTPKLSNGNGGGRDHWSLAYTSLLAGGGIARGRVVGKTDRHGGTVVDRPVSPKDILATLYHLLGIDTHMMLAERTGRPVPLLPEGDLVPEVLA